MNKQKYLIFVVTLILAHRATAAGGAHGGLDEHTIKTIIYQTINVVIMFVGLIYFLRKPVKEFFVTKKENFVASAKKAEAALHAAEQERSQISMRLTKLESSASESISRAKAEAAEMKNQIIAEANALSKRIKDEAQQAALIEVKKANQAIRENMIKESVEIARSQMGTSVSSADHQRLQGNFVNNIQAVQR